MAEEEELGKAGEVQDKAVVEWTKGGQGRSALGTSPFNWELIIEVNETKRSITK